MEAWRQTRNRLVSASLERYDQIEDLSRATAHGTIATTSLALFLRGALVQHPAKLAATRTIRRQSEECGDNQQPSLNA